MTLSKSSFLRPLASLRLTVALLAMSIVLIFAATWAQVDNGIWTIVRDYFRSYLVWIDLNMFLPGDATTRIQLPWPGGFLLGAVLVINLLSAHAVRFSLTWRRSGIHLIHLALLLFLGGEAITGLLATESQMPIYEGGTTHWSQDIRQFELAIIDHRADEVDNVVVIREKKMRELDRSKTTLTHAALPFDVQVLRLVDNAILRDVGANGRGKPAATSGLGLNVSMAEAPRATGVDGGSVDIPAAVVKLTRDEKDLGTWLLSPGLQAADVAYKVLSQEVLVDGVAYDISLRFRRQYHDFAITLNDFTHEKYTGTSVARNFASDVRLIDPVSNEDRLVNIHMNSPMRYRGSTFYQSGYIPPARGTVLQVVRNPGWQVPYLAFTLMSVGLLVHFGMCLIRFLSKPRTAGAEQRSAEPDLPLAQRALPWAGVAICMALLILAGLGGDIPVDEDVFVFTPAQAGTLDVDIEASTPDVDGKAAEGAIVQMEITDDRNGRLFGIECGNGINRGSVQLAGRAKYFVKIRSNHDAPARYMAQLRMSGAAEDIPGGGSAVSGDHAGSDEADVVDETEPNDAASEADVFDLGPGGAVILRGASESYALDAFSRLPVSYQGRVKPFDTVARNTLTILSGRQSLQRDGRRVEASRWLLDLMANPTLAMSDPVFRVDHPQVRDLIGAKRDQGKRLSFQDIKPHVQDLFREAQRVEDVRPRDRTTYEMKALELAKHVAIFDTLAANRGLHPIPPWGMHDDWMTLPAAAAHAKGLEQWPVPLDAYRMMLTAYAHQEAPQFNKALADYSAQLADRNPQTWRKAGFETFLNRYAPFSLARVLYVIVALLVFASWLIWRRPLSATAYGILAVTAVLHTLAIAARIYLSGRPPVTNLYASAVFIGWGAVIFCMVLERLFRNGIGTLAAAVSGFLTLLVAAALAGDGDTMAVLVAVLDTNFWLATHVVVVTLGYSATFLAGLLGIILIIRGLFTRTLDADSAKRMGQMLYGVLCFALLFSLVGTVLGGIWADQSWGRFWGWDPKENGALLIVLWNALVLHARWCGLVKLRGMAVLSIFGNIVTSWSWFGTNMLGVGLHSYGFIDSAVFWLALFIFSQLTLMAVGMVPLAHWRSSAVAKTAWATAHPRTVASPASS